MLVAKQVTTSTEFLKWCQIIREDKLELKDWEHYLANICFQIYLVRYTIENLLVSDKPEIKVTKDDFLLQRKLKETKKIEQATREEIIKAKKRPWFYWLGLGGKRRTNPRPQDKPKVLTRRGPK